MHEEPNVSQYCGLSDTSGPKNDYSFTIGIVMLAKNVQKFTLDQHTATTKS